MIPQPLHLAVRGVLPLLLAAAVGVLLAGCGGSSAAVPKNAVAVVGTQTVQVGDFATLLRQEQLQAAAQGKELPNQGDTGYAAVRDTATAYLVHLAEIKQKAAQMGVTVSDAEVDRAVASLKKQHFGGDEQKYEAARDEQGLTDADVAANQKSQLLTNKLFAKITKNTSVSDQALRDYYNTHQSQFISPDSRTVRHILVQTKAQANSLYAQLKAGANFVTLEKKYTKDTGPGRLLMPISKGDTVPNFEALAFGLKIGQISRPVQTAAGWHVIQALTPIKRGSLQPFAKVKAALRKQVLATKRSTVMNTWLAGVQKSFCKSQITYAKAFVPATDPCKTGAAAPTPPTSTG